MKRLLVICLAVATATVIYAFGTPTVKAADRILINIGTAGIGGTWYPTGGFICTMVNKTRKEREHNIHCAVEVTAGSVGNARGIRQDYLHLAFVQSDWQYHAYRGTNVFKDDGPDKDLRFVMSFDMHPLHLVARKDAGIKSLGDIKGKRVNTGNIGSGNEATSALVMSYFGLDPKKDLVLDPKLTSREQTTALCDNKIDAFFYATGIPAGAIQEATNTCDSVIVPITGPEVEKMLSEHPYFSHIVVPGGTYRGNPDDVPSFGVATCLLSSAKRPEDVIYEVVRAVFDNFEDFKQRSATYRNMTREGSVNNGRSIPHHPGAAKYYREVGLLK